MCVRRCGGRRPLRAEVNLEKDAWELIFPPLVSLERPWAPRSFGWCVLDYGEHINCASVAEEYLEVAIVVSRESSRVDIYIDDVPFRTYAVNYGP